MLAGRWHRTASTLAFHGFRSCAVKQVLYCKFPVWDDNFLVPMVAFQSWQSRLTGQSKLTFQVQVWRLTHCWIRRRRRAAARLGCPLTAICPQMWVCESDAGVQILEKPQSQK